MAGYPYYYQPIYGGGNYQQTQTPVMQTQAPVNNNNSGIVWVQGESGAKSYLVAPNTTVLLMDSEGNKFYLKSSDASGMPLPLRVFEYSEITLNASKSDFKQQTEENKEYALKTDLDALRRDFDALIAKKTAKEKKTDE